MSRPLRIQYPDAWYHVMNRGRRGESVFLEKQDYSMFVELLKEVVDMYKVRVCRLLSHTQSLPPLDSDSGWGPGQMHETFERHLHPAL